MAAADSGSSPPSHAVAPAASITSPMKENRLKLGSMVEDLDKSQADLISRLQGLKKEMHNWRSTLDLQVKTYKDELSEMKSALNNELDQLKSDFQELRGTLQQQQEDVTNSLKTLGLQDLPKDVKEPETTAMVENENVEDVKDIGSPSSEKSEKVGSSE